MVIKNSISEFFQEWEGGTQGPDMTLNIVQVLSIFSTEMNLCWNRHIDKNLKRKRDAEVQQEDNQYKKKTKVEENPPSLEFSKQGGRGVSGTTRSTFCTCKKNPDF